MTRRERLEAASPEVAGARKDDQGKPDMTFLRYWPRALKAVCQVSEFGAKKYARGGWVNVADGLRRYDSAQIRHWLEDLGTNDAESCLAHAAHTAWNALSTLELLLREKEANDE